MAVWRNLLTDSLKMIIMMGFRLQHTAQHRRAPAAEWRRHYNKVTNSREGLSSTTTEDVA